MSRWRALLLRRRHAGLPERRGDRRAGFGGLRLELEADERAVDVVVPAGTPVFFDGRLIHGARHNVSPERSSFRIIAHFVPADLPMAWRGVDFGRGYADRYEVKAPALVGALTSEL